MTFLEYTLGDIIGIVIALAIYDWGVDPLLEWMYNRHNGKKNVLEKQDIS